MRLSHGPARTRATFDDPNLVSRAGLVPVMALAERCGLSALVRWNVKITARTGVNAAAGTGSAGPGLRGMSLWASESSCWHAGVAPAGARRDRACVPAADGSPARRQPCSRRDGCHAG